MNVGYLLSITLRGLYPFLIKITDFSFLFSKNIVVYVLECRTVVATTEVVRSILEKCDRQLLYTRGKKFSAKIHLK